MLYKLRLKRSDKLVIIDDIVFYFIEEHPYLQTLQFISNLREHSNGYPVFQKWWDKIGDKHKVETIYLHKLIAEQFLGKPKTDLKLRVRVINGNKCDCRLANLEWSTMSTIVRGSKKKNKYGYKGVYKEGKGFSARIYHNKKALRIGTYATIEEAAEAYTLKHNELFGTDSKPIISTPLNTEAK